MFVPSEEFVASYGATDLNDVPTIHACDEEDSENEVLENYR